MGREYPFTARESGRRPGVVMAGLACRSAPPHRMASSEVQQTDARGAGQGQVSVPAAARVRILTDCTHRRLVRLPGLAQASAM